MIDVQLSITKKRTGEFIHQAFEAYGELSISDIHKGYKNAIKELNEVAKQRRRHCGLKVTTYHSFYVYFRNFVRLGMVEFVREEETEEVQSPELMGFMEKSTAQGRRMRTHPGAVRRIWRMTDKGRSEVEAWTDPMKALGFYPRLSSEAHQTRLQKKTKIKEE